ncbi:nuclear transport factor 2 family protein [Kordia sp.]|uniref:nuclear transport factor 2 family protein n=1 Tax=Kordia sp. TaxID=1965332 RepID=UPI0025C570E9|nr:nuclear transport factor 2 family protein [Kordia sp.]MCH2194016.1 nuclear transport factor 2 family protein [Kordia sp.]
MRKIIILLLILTPFLGIQAQKQNKAEIIVQKQIVAYNAKDIDAFAATFTDNVTFYNFPKQEFLKGKKQLRELFGDLFRKNPDLYCEIESKIVTGNIVIFQENVQFQKEQPFLEYIVMYKVENDKIKEVNFLKRPQ